VLLVTIDQIYLDRRVVEFLQVSVILAFIDEQILLEIFVVLDSQRQIENLTFASADDSDDHQQSVQQVPYCFTGHRVAVSQQAQQSSSR